MTRGGVTLPPPVIKGPFRENGLFTNDNSTVITQRAVKPYTFVNAICSIFLVTGGDLVRLLLPA